VQPHEYLPAQTAHNMGIVKTIIKLSNPRFPDIQSLEVECLVDTGALHLCITETQAIQLKFEEFRVGHKTIFVYEKNNPNPVHRIYFNSASRPKLDRRPGGVSRNAHQHCRV
jgi:hypothetical protein